MLHVCVCCGLSLTQITWDSPKDVVLSCAVLGHYGWAAQQEHIGPGKIEHALLLYCNLVACFLVVT